MTLQSLCICLCLGSYFIDHHICALLPGNDYAAYTNIIPRELEFTSMMHLDKVNVKQNMYEM